MRPGFAAEVHRKTLQNLMERANHHSKKSELKGRFLAFPLGAVLLVSIPLEKLFSLFEAVLFAFANLFTPLFPKYCSYLDLRISCKRTFYFLIGVLLSPFTAIFASTALITTMIIHPVKATERFIEQCKNI